MRMKLPTILGAAVAAFFIAGSALAQNAGTATNHAFVVGKGDGVGGFTSLLCGSAQLAVGQAAADPICQTITGDVTISAAGVTAIGASKVVNAQLATMAANTTKCNATASSAVPTDCTASTMRTNIGVVIGTNVQAWDADLDCIAAISTTGIVARTGAGTCAVRTVTAPAAGITITNGDGVSGNPTLVLANDLAALEGLSGTGIARRTGTDTWSVGTPVNLASEVTSNLPVANLNSGTGAAAGTFWNGAGVWATAVTSITCGTGLSGGAVTGAGTCAVNYAAKSDQQTATSTILAVNPAQQHSHPSAAKGWAFFNGVTTVSIGASYNVSGVVRNSAGNYTLTWSTAFSSANYAVIVQCNDNGSGAGSMGLLETTTASAVSFICINPSTLAAADASKVSVVSYGAQ